MPFRTVVLGGLMLLAISTQAEVTRVEIEHHTDVLGGRSFGLVGGYEQFIGTIYFEADPRNPANTIVIDIEHAPTNAAGRVEHSANFTLIKPKDMGRANGTILFGTSNRGSRRLLTFFNHAHAAGEEWDAPVPTTADNYGDGFLMENGFTLLWVGWQWDTPESREGASRSFVPQTVDDGDPIEGLVRSDFHVTRRVFDRTLADRNHIPYPVSDPTAPENVLTVRDTREAPRQVVPRSQWDFARLDNGVKVADPTRIYLEGGFEPFKIYEVIYKAENPQVIGLGLVGIRDAISWFKYGAPTALNTPAGAIKRAIGFGLSQPGRTLRTFVYQGFNADEQQRKVFDGIMAHIAGPARGSFNLRFGQASRDAHPFINFFYPTDIFPFTDVEQTDPLTGKTDGMLSHVPENFMPKVFNSFSSYEYWGRAASLMHTTVDGMHDAPMMDNARVYHFAGAQHLPDPFPPPVENGQQPNNPNDFSWMMRALLLAMNRWVTDGTPAPPSRFLSVEKHEVVKPEDVRWPAIPGVAFPQVPHLAYRVDYGPLFESEGIVTKEPPVVGTPYPVFVPQVDADGNEIGALRMPEIVAPLATYTGWNLYNAENGPTDVISHMSGSFIPFPRTRAERERNDDPRLSIEERYKSRAEYLGLIADATLELIAQGYLVDGDMPEIVDAAGRHWDYLMNDER
jgi:hypothetical protein